jgi:hypothetical protein
MDSTANAAEPSLAEQKAEFDAAGGELPATLTPEQFQQCVEEMDRLTPEEFQDWRRRCDALKRRGDAVKTRFYRRLALMQSRAARARIARAIGAHRRPRGDRRLGRGGRPAARATARRTANSSRGSPEDDPPGPPSPRSSRPWRSKTDRQLAERALTARDFLIRFGSAERALAALGGMAAAARRAI